MTTVISDNKTQKRNYIRSLTSSGQGSIFNLDTSDFSYNKIIECKDLPFDLAEQAMEKHRTGRLRVKFGNENNTEIAVIDSYEPFGENQTRLHFVGSNLNNKPDIINLPAEAIDLLAVNQSWNLPNPTYGKAIDLSTEEKIDALRKEYEKGALNHFSDGFGMPLNITEEGVQVILQQAQKTKERSFMGEILSLSGLTQLFGRSSKQPKETTLTLDSPINPALVAEHLANDNAQQKAQEYGALTH